MHTDVLHNVTDGPSILKIAFSSISEKCLVLKWQKTESKKKKTQHEVDASVKMYVHVGNKGRKDSDRSLGLLCMGLRSFQIYAESQKSVLLGNCCLFSSFYSYFLFLKSLKEKNKQIPVDLSVTHRGFTWLIFNGEAPIQAIGLLDMPPFHIAWSRAAAII